MNDRSNNIFNCRSFEVLQTSLCSCKRVNKDETFIEFELGTYSNLEFKGEYVVMISGYVEHEPSINDIIETAKKFLEKGIQKRCVNLTSDKLNVNKNLFMFSYKK